MDVRLTDPFPGHIILTMAIHLLRREQFIPRPLDQVFAFFSDARNLERITPRWLRFEIVRGGESEVRSGLLLDYRLRWHGLPLGWRTEITRWDPPHGFADEQRRGPYRLWQHTHRFSAEGDGTRMLDEVRYQLPLGVLGEIAHRLAVRRDLERVFDFRQHQIAELSPRRHSPVIHGHSPIRRRRPHLPPRKLNS
jgi:ligand-binding SRPBCC domain-containing protein